ncbi:hypothetical protein [Taibaiella soli]|uniref:Outer membrane protein beta-barrel domain-containing protein n=1 Tax=Taibaiella soli TaxID=1649169 RepID=A0A2W2AVL0_9BACT|nr:hypothetical protein [Taibaiella soli]PZF71718.1 hypothetical protein DN068_16760 [Taibaiella soli]
MNFGYTLKTILVSLILALPLLSHAQDDENRHRWTERFEIGYSFCLSSATFQYKEHKFDSESLTVSDSTHSDKITSKGGFGATLGTYFPIAKIGTRGSLAISTTFLFNAIAWEPGGFSYSSNSQTGTTSTGSGTMEMALPIGVDYKFGCDAIQDKSRRFCYSLGAGFYPSYTMTVYKGNNGTAGHLLPYLKGEIGFFAGICFKARATYSFGNIKYVSYEESGGNTAINLSGKSGLTLSLIMMPMSWKWGKAEWWR